MQVCLEWRINKYRVERRSLLNRLWFTSLRYTKSIHKFHFRVHKLLHVKEGAAFVELMGLLLTPSACLRQVNMDSLMRCRLGCLRFFTFGQKGRSPGLMFSVKKTKIWATLHLTVQVSWQLKSQKKPKNAFWTTNRFSSALVCLDCWANHWASRPS